MAFLVRQGEKCQNSVFLAVSEPSGLTRFSEINEIVFFVFISTHFFISESFKAIRWKLNNYPTAGRKMSPSARVRGRITSSSEVRFFIFLRIVLKLSDSKKWVKISEKSTILYISVNWVAHEDQETAKNARFRHVSPCFTRNAIS